MRYSPVYGHSYNTDFVALIGKTFGRFTVLDYPRYHTPTAPSSKLTVQCSCGNIRSVPASALTHGGTRSCGCLARDKWNALAHARIGQRFGRLVIEQVESRNPTRYRCKCDCGNTTIASYPNLRRGNITSCKCLQKELNRERGITLRTSPRWTHKRTYTTWNCMKGRCNNPKHDQYKNYGGRGIRICDRWLTDFYAFLADMGERPEGKTIDRIDVNGNYEPGNCKWSTPAEQRANTRK